MCWNTRKVAESWVRASAVDLVNGVVVSPDTDPGEIIE